MDFSATIGDLKDQSLSHLDIGEQDVRFVVEIGEEGSVAIIFGEPLAFHLEYGLPDGIVDSDHNLTKDGSVRIQTFLRALLTEKTGIDGSLLHLDADDATFVCGDDPGFAITLAVKVDPSSTVQALHDNMIVPFVALMINVSDPGTFNHPYLFANI